MNVYHATVRQEGENGSIRAKLPVGLIRDIGAKDGSVVEFEVKGKSIVGTRLLTAAEVRKYNSAPTNKTAPAKKAAPAKPKAKAVPAKAKKKAPARRTKVEYEVPDAPVHKKKKKLVFRRK